MEQSISHRQLRALTFVAMLCPFLRLLPAAITRQAGSAAWVSAALSVIPTAVLAWMLEQLHTEQGGLGRQIFRCLGSFAGSVVLCVWSLWLLIHSGFLLRSGADRFIATVYRGASPAFFIIVTALLCFIAACGSLRAMGRLTELLRPLLVGVIFLVLVFSLEEVEPTFLLPVTQKQIPHILRGVPYGAEPLSLVLVNAAFLYGSTKKEKPAGFSLLWIGGIALLAAVFCGVCVGSLGKTYTDSIAYPFFVLARDLSIISGVERIEALVVALWFLPDFVLITVELMIVRENMKQVIGTPVSSTVQSWLMAALTAFAGVIAFTLFSQTGRGAHWSETVIPAVQLFWAYGAVPVLLVISRIRKKF